MKKVIYIAGLIFSWQALAQSVSPEDVKRAQQIMNSPEYKRQMQHMMREMKKQGMDTSTIEAAPPVNARTMEAAMGMRQCMDEKVGNEGMQRMSEEGKEVREKINALCAEGKRDEAEEVQREYAKTMMESKEYQGMKECGEKYKDIMDDPSMATMKKRVENMKHASPKHVCG